MPFPLTYDAELLWDSAIYTWDGGPFAISTIEKDLAGHLIATVPLVEGRVMPGRVYQNWPTPFVTFFRQEQEHGHDLDGAAGWAQPNFELRCWSRDYYEAKQAAEQIRLAMQGFTGIWGDTEVLSVVLESDADTFEAPEDGSDVGHHCVVLIYSVLYTESIPDWGT